MARILYRTFCPIMHPSNFHRPHPHTVKHLPPPDRRIDHTRRNRVADMSADDMRRELLTHDLTGIPNRRAYQEAAKLPTLVVIDVDSLKWVNDQFGHEAGDRLLQIVAVALRDATPEAYHIGGDEFMVQAPSRRAAHRIMAQVATRLNHCSIAVQDKGQVCISVSYGVGTDLAQADVELQRNKARRQTAGLRAARGERPASFVNMDTAERSAYTVGVRR